MPHPNQRAASEFLRAIRGPRSQVAFARRLGYRGNPITDWENGRRFPTAEEALRAAERVGLDVPAAFRRFHPADALTTRKGRHDVAAWLVRLRGTMPMKEIATRSGSSRHAVGRWLNGKAKPRVPELFSLVDAITGRLPDLVAELVPIAEVPALRARYEAARAARTIAFEEPWTEAVLRIVETTGYASRPRHDTAYVARALGIPTDVAQRAIEALEHAAVIQRRGRRYRPIGSLTVETRGRPERLIELRRHWAAVAAGRAPEPGPDDLFAYNVISASAEDLDRIDQLLRATFREIRSIVAASEPVERAALLTMQLCRFDEGGQSGSDEANGSRPSRS